MSNENRFEEIVYSRYRARVRDMAIVEVDEGFEQILGYSAEDVKERHMCVKDIMLEEDWESYAELVVARMRAKGEAYLGHRLKKKNGEVIYVFCFGSCATDASDGELYGDILITDITNAWRMEQQIEHLQGTNYELNTELMDRSRMMESVLNNLAGGVSVFDFSNRQSKLTYISESFLKLFSLKREQIGQYANDFIKLAIGDDRKKLRKQIQNTMSSNRMTMGEYRFKNINQPEEYFWVQVCLTMLSARKGVFTVCAVCIDITDKKNDEMEKNAQTEMLKLVAQGSDEMLLSYDIASDKMRISKYVEGHAIDVFDDAGFLNEIENCQLLHPDDKEQLASLVCDMKETKSRDTVEFRIDFSGNGMYTWHRAVLVSVADANGRVHRIVGKLYSIHEEKMRSQELILRAERDSLTGIYNHSTFVTKVTRFLSEYSGELCAFYMIDLDDFKLVNDALGHYAGDDLLCDTAVVLENAANTFGGFSGRLGGDEFALFIPDVVDEATAEKIADAINQGMVDIECEVEHSASVGIAINRIDDNLLYEKLYYQADQAMYNSKRQGKNRWMFFKDAMLEPDESQADHKISTYLDDEDYLLDDISDVVYVADVNNYELQFMNKAAKLSLGMEESDDSYIGKPCYQVLQGMDAPCNFCTNKILSDEHSLISHHKNMNNGKEYVYKDRIVSWNGKKCRMDMAVDISNADRMTQVLSNRYDIEDALISSITQIAKGGPHATSYNKLLETLGEYYGAKHACLIECDRKKVQEIHEWKSANDASYGEKLNVFLDEAMDRELESLSSPKGALLITHVTDYPYKTSPLYKFFVENRIWSVYSVPIKNGQAESIGRLVIFNPQLHDGDLKLMNLLSMYIGGDIVSRGMADERNYEMTHDRVTKAYNRSCYMAYTNRRRSLSSIGIVIVDINEVRKIYDEFGQAVVDNLMVQYYNMLEKLFADDCIYRIGDDDFVVICENADKDHFLETIGKLKKQLQIGEFSACLGYVWDDYDKDIKKMEEHARDMLYMEKQKWYDVKDEHSYKWNTLTRGLVKDDIVNGMFRVVLQPKVDYTNDCCYGAEALVRYSKEENLANVIDRLEKNRNIKYMDLFVLKQVCQMLIRWQEAGLQMIPISCNFSRVSLLEEDMPEKINAIVEKYKVPKEMIEIEITESVGEMEHEMVARIANKLHGAGFRLAMDDFGTKYSNVSILSSMKFDVIKLDRSMVYNIDKNIASRKILKHLVDMCHDLGVECIAEGVETREQAEYLKEMGCVHIQGYLYSKPVDMDTFERMYIRKN